MGAILIFDAESKIKIMVNLPFPGIKTFQLSKIFLPSTSGAMQPLHSTISGTGACEAYVCIYVYNTII